MPKAVVFEAPGGPEKLKLEDKALRDPAEGEDKMRVEAVGLNRAELLYLAGQYFEKHELPSRIGYEVAGVAHRQTAGDRARVFHE